MVAPPYLVIDGRRMIANYNHLVKKRLHLSGRWRQSNVMKIRAITAFVPLTWPFDSQAIAGVGQFLQQAQSRFEDAGYPVQTLRLATPPFAQVAAKASVDGWVKFARTLEDAARQAGIEYVSIGTVMADTPQSDIAPLRAIPEIIARTESTFTSALVASAETGINLAAIQTCAEAIVRIGKATADGFGNLRFAMLANVAANGPFFPGSYHRNGSPITFAIATEAADLAVSALQHAQSPAEAQSNLVNRINLHARRLEGAAAAVARKNAIPFAGIDFSLAPFPTADKSIGAAMEHLGLAAFGGHGTLFATAFLTDCLKQADFKKAGYNGVMLPVLEDPVLAQRATDGTYTVNDLLLYSAVCGTGLDTVPIPADTSAAQIAGLLLDVATLAVKLNKPLTARLLPVPGLKAGEQTAFEFEYFANGAALALKPQPHSSQFAKDSFFHFLAR